MQRHNCVSKNFNRGISVLREIIFSCHFPSYTLRPMCQCISEFELINLLFYMVQVILIMQAWHSHKHYLIQSRHLWKGSFLYLIVPKINSEKAAFCSDILKSSNRMVIIRTTPLSPDDMIDFLHCIF